MPVSCLVEKPINPKKHSSGVWVEGGWQDKGHFQTGFDVPLHLKIVKEDDVFLRVTTERTKKMSGPFLAAKRGTINSTWNELVSVL